MDMVFFTATDTTLFFSWWKPSSEAQYAGSCIFLILLATISRTLLAGKYLLEQIWLHRVRERKVLIADDQMPLTKQNGNESSPSNEMLASDDVGYDERPDNVKSPPLLHRHISIDLFRALYVTLIASVGYFLYDSLSISLDVQ